MRLFLSALVATTLAGCVSPSIENSRNFGFDAYLAGERGGYKPLPEPTKPVAQAAAPEKERPDSLDLSIPDHTFQGNGRDFGFKMLGCAKRAGITGSMKTQSAMIGNKRHRWVRANHKITQDQADILNKCVAS